jgi:hypothetical protein
MGSGASSIPDELDFDTCVNLSDGKITREIFEKLKNERGLISKAKLFELRQKTDCFLTHDWYIIIIQNSFDFKSIIIFLGV